MAAILDLQARARSILGENAPAMIDRIAAARLSGIEPPPGIGAERQARILGGLVVSDSDGGGLLLRGASTLIGSAGEEYYCSSIPLADWASLGRGPSSASRSAFLVPRGATVWLALLPPAHELGHWGLEWIVRRRDAVQIAGPLST